jgi:hypothetical protein
MDQSNQSKNLKRQQRTAGGTVVGRLVGQWMKKPGQVKNITRTDQRLTCHWLCLRRRQGHLEEETVTHKCTSQGRLLKSPWDLGEETL